MSDELLFPLNKDIMPDCRRAEKRVNGVGARWMCSD